MDDCAAAVGCAVEQLSAVMDVLLPVLRGEVGWFGRGEIISLVQRKQQDTFIIELTYY